MSAYALLFPEKKIQPCAACFAVAGLLPVSSIALHCAGLISLENCLSFLILPILFFALALASFKPALLKLVFQGWVAGIVAVTFYDLVRIPFILAGWEDFIPHISFFLTGSDDHAYLIGYLWRYAGNGGGLGIAFFLLAEQYGWKKYVVSNGVTFGLGVFASLLILLVIFPQAQELMFEISPLSFFGGLAGHIVYGFVLGKLMQKFLKKQ